MNKFIWATILAPLLIAIIYGAISLTSIPTNNYTILIASAGVTATLYLGLVKYWIDSDGMFKSLFIEFNLRFDKLNEELNNVAEGKPLTGEKTSEQIIQDYLNLCAEEYYWFKKGRIPKAVWISWSAGINDYIVLPPIRTFFKNQLPYKDSYYGFLNFVEDKL
ncbi:hypothetical protein [Mucilaginibacter sp. SJ]|uniref:hypothetical protein n=1 Tax=Mucilaginibacter sp. SJ TaxID=3029053 RepID=UPI0023A994F4|nr:hypothetical protein [Mucilaginibacter sp. SJ]WDZ99610.1 hypothetical protein MusilaSJ_19285 [Mucilaginibacter sp. SJ]